MQSLSVMFLQTTVCFYRPYDNHIARSGSQTIHKGAENRYSHVGGEASAAVLGVRALAQPHRPTAACWKGGRHTAAVVKYLGMREYLTLKSFVPAFLEMRLVH